MIKVITGMPRSRTAWFSVWLNAMRVPAEHELIMQHNNVEAFKWERRSVVDCCTYQSEIRDACPVDKCVVIHRTPESCHASTEKLLGFPCDITRFEAMSERLYELEGLHIEYDEIDMRLPEIWEYLDFGILRMNNAATGRMIGMKVDSMSDWNSKEIIEAAELLRTIGVFEQ